MIYDPKTGEFDAHAALKFHKAIAERPKDWAEYLTSEAEYLTSECSALPSPDDFLDFLEMIDAVD